MKILDIDVKVIKDKQKIKSFQKTFNTNEPLTVEHIKDVIKNEMGFPFEIVKEEFYCKSNELKNEDNAPFKSGNEFILTIK
jgi:RNAse (barnase) inhibitor barstar